MNTFEVLGDPHLGRSFIAGVPLHRRGEREASIWADFKTSLWNASKDFHINMGDLFDKPYVSYDTISRAADIYLDAAARRPKTTFVILRGNHDASRDMEKISAFDIFHMIVAQTENIVVVVAPIQIDEFQFYPWDPIRTSTNMVIDAPCKAAFGHWDIDSYGGDDHNLVPLDLLQAESVYTGHIHKPEVRGKLTVVGSMQPLAHGEGDLYVTKTLDEVKLHPDAFKDKCLRVDLVPGEIFDIEVDCMQLTVRRGAEEETFDACEVGAFDMMDLFKQAFTLEQVSEPIQSKVLERYAGLR